MHLEVSPSSDSTATPSIRPRSFNNNSNNNERIWARSRRQTEPLTLTREQQADLAPSHRFSIDSVSRLSNSKSSSLLSFANSQSSALSSDSFSNPALANFSPRKKNSLSFSPTVRQHGHSSPSTNTATATALQTPQKTRDLDSQSPSTTTNITARVNNNLTRSLSYSNSNSPAATAAAAAATTPLSPVSPTTNPPSSTSASASKEPKSPLHQKRAPASRSSLGIETSSGPPPALSTRKRSLTQDKPRQSQVTSESPKRPRSFGLAVSQQDSSTQPSPTPSIDAVMNGEAQPDSGRTRRLRTSLPARTSSILVRDKERNTPASSRLSSIHTTPNGERNLKDGANTDTSGKESSTESKSEDLFLNIARSSTGRRDSLSNKTERRRSKFGLSSRSRTVEETPSPDQSQYDSGQMTSPFSQDNSPLVGYGTSSGIRPSSSAHPLDDSNRLRYFGVSARSSVGAPRSRLGRSHRELSPETSQPFAVERRDSIHDSGQSRSYRPSNLSGSRTVTGLSSAGAPERSKVEIDKSKHEGTESTLSTTAPSTVWDELDDLKSRIRKLELTGKFPSSSAAAMSSMSGERPRTATTTVTTMSSSPKQGRKTSTPPPESEPTIVPTQIHPLLHTALAKAKPVLNSEVYRTLEATVTDALVLAAILGSNSTQISSSSASVVNGAPSSDRHLRRKADSMCRSLTELCLALSDEQLISLAKGRPVSRDTAGSNSFHMNNIETESTTPTITCRRSTSHEPEELSRAQTSFGREIPSRLDGRRTNILSPSASSHALRGHDPSDSNQTIKLSSPPQRIGRSSTLFRANRPFDDDGYGERTLTSRPISRSATDINLGAKDRTRPRDRISRDYNPQSNSEYHDAQPEQPQHQYKSQPHAKNPSQSGIPLRRSFMPTPTSIPTASHINIQPGFRRYGTAGGNSGSASQQVDRNAVEDTSSSSRDGYSQQQPRSAGRTATHYSSLQHLRNRNNSIGTRRINIPQ